MRQLLKHTAHFDCGVKFGWTPLHVASIEGHVDMMQCLLESGARVNLRTISQKTTPLHLTAHFGHDKGLRLLL
jgi:ankyrin repeat protein